jgi:hypothetical protein
VATRIPARLTAKAGRKFGLSVGAAFLALGGVALWRGREPLMLGFGALGTALVLAGALAPTRLGPVQRAWMGLAHAISKVTTPIVMGVIYFIVLAPVGVMMRLFGRNPLTAHHGDASVWVSRGEDRRSSLERQF